MTDPNPQDAILPSIKKLLGIDVEDTAFDLDITLFINSAFSTLFQLGVGPQDEEFSISSATDLWSAFIGENLSPTSVQSYIYISVRLIFDPPATASTQSAFQAQLEELAWRMNVQQEEKRQPWAAPLTTS